MDSIKWHYEPLGWAACVYSQTAPQTGFKGRMAALFYLAVIWAFGWYRKPYFGDSDSHVFEDANQSF
jgi:hypothetical protein